MKDWKKYLPSRRFLVIGGWIIIGILLIVGIRALVKLEQRKAADKANMPHKKITIGEVVERDSDSDGIKDWEETLWGTDPQKAVTFEIPDAKYIEQKKKAMATDSGASFSGDTAPLNETQKVAREIFSTTLALNQSGVLSADSANSIADSVANYIKNYKGGEDYKYEVIKLAKDSSSATVKKYYTAVTDLLTIHTKQMDNSLYVINQATLNEDPALLRQMDPIIKNNEKTISALLKMTVPADVGFIHLKLLNSLNKINQNEKDMMQLFENPIVSLAAVTQYPENLISMQSAIQELRAYFTGRGL